MQTRRVRLRVRGRVQGVSFRASTRARALELGLSGWVRNERCGGRASDHTQVTLEVQGDSAAVDQLVAWCRRGPMMARVDDVELTPTVTVPGELGFVVAPTPTDAAQ